MAILQNLPAEIFSEIAKHLDHNSVQRFLRTNRRLHKFVKGDRYNFAKVDIDLVINLNKEKNDVMSISIRKSDRKNGGFKRSQEFQSFHEVFDEYLGEILSACNPISLSIYQCSSDLLYKLTQKIQRFQCKLEFLELNCGSANVKIVEKFLNSVTPKRIVYRAETNRHVTKAIYETKAFKSTTELDVMVFRKSASKSPLPSVCLTSIKAPFFSTNIPIEINNETLKGLITDFLKGARDFDANLGWNIPCKTDLLNEILVFSGQKFETKILLDNEHRPCGRLFELKRDRQTGSTLRLMWTASSLIVNGILFTLRENFDFIAV
ncbi:unnamed protein product, partial [Mesorhabditis belari]|uniref:F-box domain-containing protein n=1 Tax=Mesorhabditis belari TaxID=2138241 RepID=A0AAF3J483_9BILA